jgi:hypothetical protein
VLSKIIMETDVVWISFVVVVLGVTGLALLIYKLGSRPRTLDFSGIWLNESLNIRILLYDIDSEFHGSVIWTNGMDKLLGFKVVEDLRFDRSKRGRGKYSDPLTGQQYEISLCMKREGIIQLKAYHPDSENLIFSQEWKQFLS